MKKPGFAIKQHLTNIAKYLETENFEAAGSTYLYLHSKTKNWSFANDAGICFQKVNMLSKAAKAFKKALRTTPNPYAVLIHIGINYSLAMDFKKAREILEEVLYQTINPRVAFELAKIAYHEHRWMDALNHLNLCLTYQLIQNNTNTAPKTVRDPKLTNLVFFYKARIFALELDDYEKACTVLQYLKSKANDKAHIFTFIKEAADRGKIKIAKFAAILLIEDYKKYKAIQELYDFLELC